MQARHLHVHQHEVVRLTRDRRSVHHRHRLGAVIGEVSVDPGNFGQARINIWLLS